MHDALTTYFDGEKNAGLLIAGVGIAILALAAVFYQARWGLRSFAVTLGVLALAEIAIGVGLYLRTGRRSPICSASSVPTVRASSPRKEHA